MSTGCQKYEQVVNGSYEYDDKPDKSAQKKKIIAICAEEKAKEILRKKGYTIDDKKDYAEKCSKKNPNREKENKLNICNTLNDEIRSQETLLANASTSRSLNDDINYGIASETFDPVPYEKGEEFEGKSTKELMNKLHPNPQSQQQSQASSWWPFSRSQGGKKRRKLESRKKKNKNILKKTKTKSRSRRSSSSRQQ
jgi:hypothetical protein